MPQIVESTLVLLRQQSVCQQIESDGDADDDDTGHDEVLMDAVSDLIPAFAKAMGSHFAPIFAKLFDPLMKFSVSLLRFMLKSLLVLSRGVIFDACICKWVDVG